MIVTCFIAERDREVVKRDQNAGNGRTRPRSDRDHSGLGLRYAGGSAPETDSLGKNKTLLERRRIVLGSDMGEVASRRMAGVAVTGTIKVCLAGFCISGNDVEHFGVRPTTQRVVHA